MRGLFIESKKTKWNRASVIDEGESFKVEVKYLHVGKLAG